MKLWGGRFEKEPDAAIAAMIAAVLLSSLLVPLQVVLGDLHGVNTLEHQPAKLAAIEGIWESGPGQPAVIFALPDSLTLVSTTANIRLESFLYTEESFAAARDHLHTRHVVRLVPRLAAPPPVRARCPLPMIRTSNREELSILS